MQYPESQKEVEALSKRFQDVVSDIQRYAEKYRRDPHDVKLVAVSKRQETWKTAELIRLGHTDFAENYVQEGVSKVEQIQEFCTESEVSLRPVWHFIGHIQSRKCRDIAENFDWVHTIESIKVADKLDQHRQDREPLNVLIQVNLQQEESKSGVNPDDVTSLARHVTGLENLNLRGIMIIPRPESEFDAQRQIFRQTRNILDDLNSNGFDLDQLSMGMSGDIEAAIAEGATMVRVGTAIFGARPD